MKIVHILPALTKGGGERVAVDLANESVRRDHEVAIVAAYPVDPAELADRIAVKIDLRFIRDVPPGRLAKFRTAAHWVDANWDWLASHDVVHAHLTYGGFVAGLIRSRRRRLKAVGPAVVETCHSVGMPMRAHMRLLYARLSTNRDGLALMAQDPFWNRFRARHPALHSEVILNGVSAPRDVPIDEALAWRRAIGMPDRARIAAGTIGVLRPERRPLDFVSLFARLAKRLGPDDHFLMGGGGAMMAQVQQVIAATGLADRIHLPGMIDEPAVALQGIDLYLTLNVGPVTGIAALEAAMAGLPVLALQTQPDYRPGGQDWIWSTPDPDELADKTVALLADDTARRELADRQRQHARAHHGVEAMADAYEAFYGAAIAAARRDAAR